MVLATKYNSHFSNHREPVSENEFTTSRRTFEYRKCTDYRLAYYGYPNKTCIKARTRSEIQRPKTLLLLAFLSFILDKKELIQAIDSQIRN